jgi:hypothetical protein
VAQRILIVRFKSMSRDWSIECELLTKECSSQDLLLNRKQVLVHDVLARSIDIDHTARRWFKYVQFIEAVPEQDHRGEL